MQEQNNIMEKIMKNISILGSTGSIGTQTLDIVRANNDLNVVAIAAGSNVKMLEEQIREFHPKLVCVYNEEAAGRLKTAVADTDVKVVAGMDGLIEAATYNSAQIVVTAFVGMIGIRPTLEAIKAGKDIALANKETLVTAGHLVMEAAKEYGVKILPVDSEHSAIFQSLNGENKKEIDKILLTASGGPFRGWTREQMKNVQVEDALKHPNWAMGQKITIDSATMVNKGLEVIEAKWLFDVDIDHVQAVVQPQSIIHSMVQYKDGAVIAQLGTPDMKLPIQYALYYPERRYLAGDRLDFAKIGQITFEEPDLNNFAGLKMAYEAGRMGGSMPTVFNAANEKAVAKFLNREIGFWDITDMIQYCMEQHENINHPTVEQILEIEQWVYELIENRW
jgi:1-deoxy-D-xylulose-5-phosphate reductoisomerase